MQIIPNLRILLTNPTLSNLLQVRQNPSFLRPATMAPIKVVAEYAKSARSSCKKCDEKIKNSSLRLGSVTRDKRLGFDRTKWYHLDCFAMDSVSLASAEDVDGFSSLKSSDQEALTKLLDESARPGEKGAIGDEDAVKRTDGRISKGSKVREKDDDENNEQEDRKSKKGKLSTTTEGAELDLSFSTMAPSKVVAEYAKSTRSSCKKCDKKIDAGTLRLGSVTRDKKQGFDMTKWHHLDCFPMDSVSVSLAEDIDGFSSLKSSDQEALTKLVDEIGRQKGAIGDEDVVKGTEDRIPKRSKVREKDDNENNELEDRKPKKGKLSTTTEGAELDLSFSTMVPSAMVPSKVIVEYAKSMRSSCKKCDKKIDAGALRLGSVTRDKRRGFDMTKWHHLDCFPMDSASVSSAEDIDGFSSLKSSDQEALTKLVDEIARQKGTIGDEVAVKGTKERIPERSKVREKDDNENNELEDRKPKKGKLSTTTEAAELDQSFSISDIQIKYKDAVLLPKWKAFRTVIFLEQDEGLQDSRKIAAFDFDGCLVNTSVKKVGPDAWSLMYPSIPEKLQSLYNEGYKLVIFTNESNIDRWKNKRQVAVDSKIGRLTNFIKHVKVPMQVFIACGIGKSGGQAEDPFRKPNPGMWHLMDWHFNSGISIDMDQSFYVGDAAGRENDHSDADIKFAEAVGLKFYVPEEYFKV